MSSGSPSEVDESERQELGLIKPPEACLGIHVGAPLGGWDERPMYIEGSER